MQVSVPCSSLFDTVTVRCGHCGSLWSVNMAAAAFNSLSTASVIAASEQQQQQADFLHQAPNYNNMGEYRVDHNMISSTNKSNYNNKAGLFQPNSLITPTSNSSTEERMVNRPPEKRQRVPSAYNQFIKEEIQRIKATNPHISHREAFSTAAKNFSIQRGFMSNPFSAKG
ncbi:hypothetical protein Cgig2_023715 [Carnegiea gigantea]|uniref:YABBY transcription factor n=1 Tax=Carnegiea gigantea TaxID=171969 RepID=A0A9Q1KK02_9CARY|nr:hypothetical protein Cgig2_023715 [Carnegiea gigantea]